MNAISSVHLKKIKKIGNVIIVALLFIGPDLNLRRTDMPAFDCSIWPLDEG